MTDKDYIINNLIVIPDDIKANTASLRKVLRIIAKNHQFKVSVTMVERTDIVVKFVGSINSNLLNEIYEGINHHHITFYMMVNESFYNIRDFLRAETY